MGLARSIDVHFILYESKRLEVRLEELTEMVRSGDMEGLKNTKRHPRGGVLGTEKKARRDTKFEEVKLEEVNAGVGSPSSPTNKSCATNGGATGPANALD